MLNFRGGPDQCVTSQRIWGFQKREKPHLKALICGNLEPEPQWYGSNFILCYAVMKIGVLYGKR